MNIQKHHIEKFKKLYKKEYGTSLSNEKAIESCHKLVNLVKAVYFPVKKDEYNKLKEVINEL